jgi:hypothetical protein
MTGFCGYIYVFDNTDETEIANAFWNNPNRKFGFDK